MGFKMDRTGIPVVIAFNTLTPDTNPDTDPHEAEAAAYQAERDVVVFVFRHHLLPGGQWESLMRQHPPVDDADDFNMDTFAPAAIQAAVTSWEQVHGATILDQGDRLTDEQIGELWAEWPSWARIRLFRMIERQNLMGDGLGKALFGLNDTDAKPDTTG